MSNYLLEIKDLSKHFITGKSVIKAVDGVNLSIRSGEALGLVGESGCGKTTLGRTIVRLITPTSGTVLFNGQDIFSADRKTSRILSREIQMIFQDSTGSLNPRMTAREIIGEGLDIHGLYRGKERDTKLKQLMEKVGLDSAYLSRLPHQFSGGQRQRIGIARALAVDPSLIICDEPVSALDVSVQAQIVNLLKSLLKEQELTCLFISHDLAVVRYICNRIAVMYLGNIVELADTAEVCNNPLHPYTKALLSAVAVPDPRLEKTRQRIIIPGDVQNLYEPGVGCVFKGRCPDRRDICYHEKPQLKNFQQDHYVSCHAVHC